MAAKGSTAPDSSEYDSDCIKCFRKYVLKEHAGGANLSEAEKNFGKGTTVRKIIRECLCENDLVSPCESSIYPKFQEPKTKKMSAENFVKKVLPGLAAVKAKKSGKEEELILTEWKKKMAKDVKETQTKPGPKTDAVVGRLTDTSKYTGSHKERFDAEGKGKGVEGREDRADNKGYVGAYKGEGTYGQKK